MTDKDLSTSKEESEDYKEKGLSVSENLNLENFNETSINEKSTLKETANDRNPNTVNKDNLLDFALQDLKKNKETLKKEIETLEKRKKEIEKEISVSFLGQSDSIARRVKGFQDYLKGAFQDLSQSVEQLDLIEQPVLVSPSPLDKNKLNLTKETEKIEPISAVADTFKPDKELITQLLEQYLQGPDYYADPWKFRRSLEPQDKEILEDWFFNMGGRGAQPSRGNRSRNILLSAALISILGELYGDRFQALVLASQPERLGEWRRGLQDALGLNREDFGPNSGVVLFERSGPLIERADRLEISNEVPLILIDAAERNIEIPILQFPIWLAFAATPDELYLEDELI